MKKALGFLIFGILLPYTCFSFAAPTCTAPDEVLSANQCWKDRNLGASQVATSMTDSEAYGNLFQWGRPEDGHQNRNSLDTTIHSSHDVPGHLYFIKQTTPPYDWRVPQNDNLWQGIGGINNPCPQGFRLPTKAEWEREKSSWSSNDAAGAFASPLKLTLGGYRYLSDGVIYYEGFSGNYWSSTVSGLDANDGTDAYNLSIGITDAIMTFNQRAIALSIRCIKN